MTGETLVHRALLYGGEEEFLAAAVPFLQEGLGESDHVLAVVPPMNEIALRDVLGTDMNSVVFINSLDFYLHPVRTIAQYNDLVREVAPRRLRALAEPSWRGRSAAEMSEWGRYESIVNAAFGRSGAQVICPYDRREISPAIREACMSTHPELLEGGYYPAYNTDYTVPESFNANVDREPLVPAPPGTDRILIESADLCAVRAFISERASRRRMNPADLNHLLIAANEVATNAVTHGTPPIELMVWTQGDSLVCEVADIGLWHPEELVGFLPPENANSIGFGLWGARMLVDLIQVRAGFHGTRVRITTRL
ncbi:MAG: sensor histidine kinase [Streptosporangiaceae bacterium]